MKDSIKKITVEDNDLNKNQEMKASERLSLIETDLNGKKILIGSWHGPNTGKNPLRSSSIVKELCEYMKKKAKGKQWMVGGDFNISYKIVENKSVIGTNKVTKGSNENNDIIYFIHTPSISISNLEELSKTDDKNVMVFDHFPLIADLSIM